MNHIMEHNISMDADMMLTNQVHVSNAMLHANAQRISLERLGTPDAAEIVCMESQEDDHQNNNLEGASAIMSSPNKNHHLPQAPALSFDQLLAKLSELIALEPKYQPNLYLPQQSNVSSPFIIFLSHFF
jgi:cyclin G2